MQDDWLADLGPDPEHMDRSFVEVICEWDRPLLADDIRLGENREKLNDIPVSIALLGADLDRESRIKGRLVYNNPIQTDDGVVNDSRSRG